MARLTKRTGNEIDCNIERGYHCTHYCTECYQGGRGCEVIRKMIRKLAEYEDTGLEPEQIYELDKMYRQLCEKMGKYKRLEEQGSLLRLPCNVGDTVYEIQPSTNRITKRKIKSIVIYNAPNLTIMYKSGYDYSILHEDIGKTVFLSESEAEQALAERKRRMSMTENEALESALEKVKAQKENFGFMERFDVDENWEVMKALEEIQQYRAIGTVEGYKRAIEVSKENYRLYLECKAKVKAYEAIDTVEEFKALKEKAEPKKPCHPPASLIWYCPNPYCPEDKKYLMSDKHKVCPECGQVIDWT